MQTKLDLITSIARRDRSSRNNNLAYLLNSENLIECFKMLKTGKAVGVDGIDLDDYASNLQENLTNLVQRMKNQAYKPQPVRRTYIPKADGKKRPLGIPAIEDKIVQKGVARILNAIYEVDFLDCSYGYRLNRGAHGALIQLDKVLSTMPINHIIDADIKGFFDNVNHEWMMKFLEHRIADPNFLRIIGRFLRNGYMEEGMVYDVDTGTPQGGIISPILANIYLHYVLDLWMEKVIKPECRGVVELIRFADDFVICIQFKDDATRIMGQLKERLMKFNLELAEDKTRLIEYGRYAKINAENKGERVATFNFLGLTHYLGLSVKGKQRTKRRTDRKKFQLKIKAMNDWLKKNRNAMTLQDLWKILRAKLRGHFQYYGVTDNFAGIKRFYKRTIRLVFKWINRRSQKKSCNWEQFWEYLAKYPLPEPKIYHKFYDLKAVM